MTQIVCTPTTIPSNARLMKRTYNIRVMSDRVPPETVGLGELTEMGDPDQTVRLHVVGNWV